MSIKIFDNESVKYDNVFKFDEDNHKTLAGEYIGKVNIFNQQNSNDFLVFLVDDKQVLINIYKDLEGCIDVLQRGDLCRVSLNEIVTTKNGNKYFKMRLEIWKK